MAIEWRQPINELLYGLIFVPEITEETIVSFANAAMGYAVLGSGPEVYYQAIHEALESGERLDRLNQVPQFTQEQIAGFLRSVDTRRDALRPWPEPRFRQLAPTTWESLAHAVPIAELNASIPQVSGVLQKGFTPIGHAQPQEHVLMLGLQTGETVALLGSYRPTENVTLLGTANSDPATVIEHFTAATGFPADKVIRL